MALALTLAPSASEACEPLGFEVEVLLPRPVGAPTNAVFYAYVVAPIPELEAQVSLVDAEGVNLEIEILTYESVGESAILRARPLAPLSPASAYTWRIAGLERPFTTAASSDDAAPEGGAIVVTELGPTTIYGCFELPGLGFEIAATELDEPVLVEVRGPNGELWGGIVPVYDGPVSVSILTQPPPEADPCFTVFVEDPGGHRRELGQTCLDAADDEPTGDGDGDSGEDGSEDAGDDGSEGSDEGGSEDTGDVPELDDPLARGCACTADDGLADERANPATAFALLVLASLGFARRRRIRPGA